MRKIKQCRLARVQCRLRGAEIDNEKEKKLLTHKKLHEC